MAMITPVVIVVTSLQIGYRVRGFPTMSESERPRFDLQSHSTCSDGALAPFEVVARAAAEGVELLALSDHDTVAGLPDALDAAARHGIALSPAAELSAVHGGYEDLHILGYELDHEHAGLNAALEDFRADRGRRVAEMAERMRELGFALDDAALDRETVGRPHLADAVLAHPDNARRLRAEGIDGRDTLFPPYLVPGAAAYIPRSRPTVPEAIEVIHAAGGVAVWAHPFWDVDAPDEALETLEAFAGHGLDGVEAFYATHTERETRLLHEAATSRGLLATGSTDFHGPNHDRFDAFRGFSLFGLEPILGPIGRKAGYQGRR
jgi:predicted metal-dependent phosphoesterase TrpH